MFKRKSQILGLWFLFWDLAATAGAWLLAFYLRVESGFFALSKAAPSLEECCASLPMVIVLALVAYHLTGQYAIHRFRRIREEVVAVLKGVFLMELLVIAATFGLQNPYESRIILILFLVLTATTILLARRLSWAAIRYLRSRGYNQSHSIIVGTGRVARKTARALRHASWMGIRNIGFIEDQPTRWSDDLDILGTTAELPALIQKYAVSNVFISLPMNRYHEARKVYDILSRTVVEVRLVADVPELASLSLTTTNLDGLPVIGLRENPHFGINVVFKRAMDIAVSALAVLLLAPVMAAIALVIKIVSPGPVFYRQERCGLNGQPFQMLKFRSMRVNAEQSTGAVWAVKDDPRRTRFGTFLRSTSLDELPQLFNVMRGEMSLVGPRPERPVFISKFSKTIPNYMARHAVKAGITGWAQVNGWRGETDTLDKMIHRVSHDLEYIRRYSFWLDVKIILLTVLGKHVRANAY
jgi:Undecaprenyl-phosphate glucose phosphotransferase